MLFRIYGCLVAHGKCIFRKCFSVGLSTGVNWFPFLFYLQIPIFRKTQRESSERETHPRAERERERKNQENPEVPDSDHRPWPRCTPKSIVIDPDRRPWPRRWIVLDPDRRPRSRRTPKPIVLDPDRCPRSRSRLRIDRDRSTNRLRAISPVVEPNRNQIMNFFFWVLFVFLDWGMKLYICLAAEKIWATSRKYVFYGIFNNTTKHQKIFFTTFSEMQPNT